MTRQVTDLTKGSLPKVFLKFSLPFVVMNILHAMYGVTDMFIIGRFVEGSSALASTAIGASVSFIFMLFVFGISAAGTIMVGRAFGAKNFPALKDIIGTMMSIYLGLGLLVMLILLTFSPLAVDLMQTPTPAKAGAIIYINYSALGMFFMCFLNMIAAVLRGVGNSLTVTIAVAFSVTLNIILDLVFIALFGWGVAGAAIATTLSQAAGVAFFIWYLRHHNFFFRFRIKDFCFYKDKAIELLRLGLPISLQNIVGEVSFLFIFALANTMGVDSAAGYGVCQRATFLTMIPALSFGLAMSAFTAQHMGAKEIVRAKKGVYTGTALTYLFSLPLFTLQIIFSEHIIGFFTDDIGTIKAGTLYLQSYSFDLLVIPILFCFWNFLNACGHTIFTAALTLTVTLGVRVPLAYFLTIPADATLYNLGWTTPITTTIESIVLIIFFSTGRWKKYGIKKE